MPAFINDFFNNPAGKGATFLNIKATKQQFDTRYEQMVKKIICSSCVTKNEIYIHIRIPSSVEGIYYDTVLQFTPTNKSVGNSIEDMEMRVFSNSPSFLYTYAYAYLMQDMFIKQFMKKISPKMRTDMAKSKNPYGVLSYDFSIYAALKFVILNGYTSIDSIKGIQETTSFSVLFKNVQHADTLQKNRKTQNDFNKLVKKQEENARKNAIKDPKHLAKVGENDSHIKDVSRSPKVSSVKTNKKVSSSKKTKRI